MKFFTGWVASAALVLTATAADAQVLANGAARAPYVAVSDFEGPYGAPEAPPPPRYGYGYGYERPPGLLPAEEVYAVLRENGFSPLGIPRLRGMVYTIAAIDRRGDDGRLVIDARDGRILRFVPADGPGFGMGPAYDPARDIGPTYEEGVVAPYGPQGALPPPTVIRSAVPRPPAAIPHVASRAVPVPRAAPRGEAPIAAARPAVPAAPQAPQPSQQAAVAQPRSAETPPQPSAPAALQAKPAPTILPTQEMPPAQGLE